MAFLTLERKKVGVKFQKKDQVRNISRGYFMIYLFYKIPQPLIYSFCVSHFGGVLVTFKEVHCGKNLIVESSLWNPYHLKPTL